MSKYIKIDSCLECPYCNNWGRGDLYENNFRCSAVESHPKITNPTEFPDFCPLLPDHIPSDVEAKPR